MTDAFASESNAPHGLASEPAQSGTDVTGTLAELERKLRELEQELTSIGRRRAGTPADAAPSPPVPSPPAPSPPVPSPPAPSPPVPSPPAAPPSAGRLVDEAIEPAPATAPAPVVTPSEAQLASLAELRRFRDRLERAGRDLAAEYDALLGRVASSLTGGHTRPAEAAGAAPAPADLPAALSAGSPSTATSGARAPSPPPQPPPQPQPATSREDALFEGRVELGVGPFYDIASLGSFERRLASLPGVSEASVRRFEASHAVVDVRLGSPIALVHELRRVIDSDFGVREIASGRILLTFDDA
jgi:hypothetical protein